MKTETGLTVKVNVETIIAECLENAVRGFFLNDLGDILEAAELVKPMDVHSVEEALDSPDVLARCADKIDNRFWCELEPLVRFPDFYEDME